MSDLVQAIAVTALVAFGQALVLMVAGIDLSVGSIMGVTGMATGAAVLAGVPAFFAVLVGLAVGLLLGLVNGTLIERLGFPDLIVTLATGIILRGVMYSVLGPNPLRGFDTDVVDFVGGGSLFGIIPMPFIIALAAFAALSFLLTTRYGRKIFAVGSNREAAVFVGINASRLRIVMYSLSGLLAAFAGILLAFRLTTVFPGAGTGYELDAIGAAVVGGTSLFGGRGNFAGVFLGALLFGLIRNMLAMLFIDPFWHQIVTGVVILLAVVVDRALRSGAGGRTAHA